MTPTENDLIRFVYHEARLLDEKRYDEWLELFTEDGWYWVPLAPGQTDPVLHTSLAYEDALLRKLRVERLKSPRAFSQQPPSRPHHLLQAPSVERFDTATSTYETRAPFLYTEAQGDSVQQFVGNVFHTLVMTDAGLKMKLKRVDLLNSDAALPAIQLFP